MSYDVPSDLRKIGVRGGGGGGEQEKAEIRFLSLTEANGTVLPCLVTRVAW